MILQREPRDWKVKFWMTRDAIAQRYGWTFPEIEKLDIESFLVIQAIMSAEARYMKRKELEMRMRMKS
jgi:hypothetical protein